MRKKVFLIVELRENEETVYAIEYTGIMTEHSIYGKLTQLVGEPTPEYIKVAKKDTVNETDKWDCLIKRTTRHIKVPYAVGMDDRRIQHIRPTELPENIFLEIQEHIEENSTE